MWSLHYCPHCRAAVFALKALHGKKSKLCTFQFGFRRMRAIFISEGLDCPARQQRMTACWKRREGVGWVKGMLKCKRLHSTGPHPGRPLTETGRYISGALSQRSGHPNRRVCQIADMVRSEWVIGQISHSQLLDHSKLFDSFWSNAKILCSSA